MVDNPYTPYVTGGGGTDFEQRVGVMYLAFLLSGQSPPGLNERVKEVGFQQSYRDILDDLTIIYDGHGGEQQKLVLQIKSRLRLTDGNNDFSRIMQDCWNTFNGKAPSGFNRDKDRFGIVAGMPSNMNDIDIQRFLNSVRRSAHAQDFDEKRNKLPRKQKRFLNNIEKQIAKAKGSHPTLDELYGFLKCFNVFYLDLDESGGSRTAAHNTLMTVTANDGIKSKMLFKHLLDIVAKYNPSGGNITRHGLLSMCTEFEIGPDPNFSRDIDTLDRHAQSCLDSIRGTIACRVKFERRSELQEIQAHLSKNEMVVIRGEPLVGKSVLLKMLARDGSSNKNCMFFKVERLEGNSLQSFLRKIGVAGDFSSILESYKNRDRYIFIDGLEHATDPGKREIISEIISRVKAHNERIAKSNKLLRWKILCSERPPGHDGASPDMETSSWPQNGILTPVTVSGLSEQETGSLLDRWAHLEHLLSNRDLKDLFSRPGILDLIIHPAFPTDRDTLKQIRSESQFARIFWSRMICNGTEDMAREQLVLRVAERTILCKPVKITEQGIDPGVVGGLLQDRILRREGSRLMFAHDYVEDMAWAFLMEGELADLFGRIQDRSDSPRLAAAFRLLSQYLLDVKRDAKTWMSSLDLIRNGSASPRWETEWIATPMLAPTFDTTFDLLSDLLHDRSEILTKFLMILRTKCVYNDCDRMESLGMGRDNVQTLQYFKVPILAKWEPVLLSIIGDLRNIKGSVLLEVSKVFLMWMKQDGERGSITRQVAETCLDLCSVYLSCRGSDEPVPYDMIEEFRDNLILSVLFGSDVIPDKVRAFLHTHAIFQSSVSHLIDSVIFEKNGWFSICRNLPDDFIDLMIFFLCSSPKSAESRWSDLDNLGIRDHFVVASLPEQNPFYVFLKIHPDKGMELIHRIVNHSMLAWRVMERESVPVIHTLKLAGKTFNVWGDNRVYRWYRFPSTGSQTVCCALMALEKWLDESIKNGGDLKELVTTILSKTNCVAVVGVCCSAMLANASKTDPSIIVPILENPVYWMMEEHRLAYEKYKQQITLNVTLLAERDAIKQFYQKLSSQPHRKRLFSNMASVVLLSGDHVLKDRLVGSIKKFEENPPRYFRRLGFVATDFCSGTDLVKVKSLCRQWTLYADIHNYTKIKSDDGVGWVVDLQTHLTKEARMREDKRADQDEIRHFCLQASQFLESGNAGSDQLIHDMIAHAQKLDNITQKIPNPYAVDFVTNLAAALVVWKWDMVVEQNLIEWCTTKITAESVIKVQEPSYSVDSTVSNRAAAKSLPCLYLRTKKKYLKNIMRAFSQHPVYEVRNCLFSNIGILWDAEPKLILQYSIDLIKTVTGKRSISGCDPQTIRWYILISVILAMPDGKKLSGLKGTSGILSLMDDLLDFTIIAATKSLCKI